LKLLTGKGSQPVIPKLHSPFLRGGLLEAKESRHHLASSEKLRKLVPFFGLV
jgi:hypothetical protein